MAQPPQRENLRTVSRRLGLVLLGGPASISLLGHFDEDFQLSKVVKFVITHFEKVSRAFWDLLLTFLPFHLPLDRDLMTFATLLAIPLACRRFILRKTEAPFAYESLADFIVVFNVSGLCVSLMVVTVALSGQSLQTNPLFWLGIGVSSVAIVLSYLHVRALHRRPPPARLGLLAFSETIAGNGGALALYVSQQNFLTATSLQVALFWCGISFYMAGGLLVRQLANRLGPKKLGTLFIVLALVALPMIYISGMSPEALQTSGYGWGLVNGLICAVLVAFTFHHLRLLPEAPIYILLLAAGVIAIDWFSRAVGPAVMAWLDQSVR